MKEYKLYNQPNQTRIDKPTKEWVEQQGGKVEMKPVGRTKWEITVQIPDEKAQEYLKKHSGGLTWED